MTYVDMKIKIESEHKPRVLLTFIHSEFTQNSLRIHSEFTQNSLRIHSEFTQNSLRIHSEFTQNSLRIHSEFTQNSLRIHSEFTQNSLRIIKDSAGGCPSDRETLQSANCGEIMSGCGIITRTKERSQKMAAIIRR